MRVSCLISRSWFPEVAAVSVKPWCWLSRCHGTVKKSGSGDQTQFRAELVVVWDLPESSPLSETDREGTCPSLHRENEAYQEPSNLASPLRTPSAEQSVQISNRECTKKLMVLFRCLCQVPLGKRPFEQALTILPVPAQEGEAYWGFVASPIRFSVWTLLP